MGGGRWVRSHDDGRIRRLGSEGFLHPPAAAAARAGDPTTLQEVLVGPAVSIWPSPSALVPLLEEAAAAIFSWHRSGVESWGNAIPT